MPLHKGVGVTSVQIAGRPHASEVNATRDAETSEKVFRLCTAQQPNQTSEVVRQ